MIPDNCLSSLYNIHVFNKQLGFYVIVLLLQYCKGKKCFIILPLQDNVYIWKFYVLGFDEYCLFETFKANCPNNEVIMMTEAQYGRMRIGKCVKSNLGKLTLLYH